MSVASQDPFFELKDSCLLCSNSNEFAADITSEALERILTEKFVSMISNVDNKESIMELLGKSAIHFLNHFNCDNMQIIDSLLATLAFDLNATQRLRKFLPSFMERFNCPEREDADALLICFKRRFGCECLSLNKFAMSEIFHMIEFGSHVEGELLVEVVLYLVRRCWEKKFVKVQIIHLARLKKMSIADFFVKCQPLLSVKVVELLCSNYAEQTDLIRSRCLLDYTDSFTSEHNFSFSEVSKQVIGNIIPYLIVKTSKESHQLLSLVLNTTKTKIECSSIIEAYCIPIIKAMIDNLEIHKIENTLSYLQKLYGRSLQLLFSKRTPDVQTFLFRNLSSHPDCAMKLLSKIIQYENGSISFERVEFNSYFMIHMLPYFTKLGSVLRNVEICVNEKTEAIRSLVIILNSLEANQIAPIGTHLKAVLSTAQECIHSSWQSQEKIGFVRAIIDSWKAYVEKHPSLGSHLVEICNYLLPLLSFDAENASHVFHSIIVERESEFSSYFVNLHFLPNIPEMASVNAVIKKVQNNLEAQRFDLAKNIQQTINNLSCDNPAVKIRHLESLRDLLRKNRTYLHKLRVPRKDESSDFVIRKLIKVLMQSCVPYESLHLVIAECLGEIGAIDPGRLDVQETNVSSLEQPLFDLLTDNFPLRLISELCLILDDKCESRIHDCVYYAVQEILKAYHVTKNSSIWNLLDDQLKVICSKLLTSEYTVQQDYFSLIKESPIYDTNLDYKDWIFLWIVKLTSLITSQLPKKVFTSCLATVKFSCSFARFLLPVILLHALQEASEEEKQQGIIGEIEAIMNISAKEIVGSSFPHPITSPMELKLSVTTTQLVEVQHLCVQTIFTVLDLFETLICSINRKRSLGEISNSNAKVFNAAESLLNGLCDSDLSAVAFSTQSYARALRYLERYLRQHPFAINDNWENFQKYYAALDDVDGVEGVIAKRGNSPSLMDAILAHEVKGQFQDVLACCEKGKKSDPSNVEYVKIHIRCLLNLDQPISAADMSLGCIYKNSKWKNDLLPYMIESSWKLSRWDDLDTLLKYDTSNADPTINVGIGKLFHFCINRNENLFEETLKQLREKEMNPIAAAAMESGAYVRAYSHLVRLHMITDLEYGLKQLSEKHFHKDIKSLLQDWRNRNSVVQSSFRFQEPMINLQRIILSINDGNKKFPEEIAKSWLLSAKIARKNGHLQRAYNCLIEADGVVEAQEISASLKCHIIREHGKYYSAKGEKDKAVHFLSQELTSLPKLVNCSSDYESVEIVTKMAVTKLHLLHATYADQISKFPSSDLIKLYKEVTYLYPNWEESHFHLAKYYDKVLPTMTKDEQKAEAMSSVIKSFRISLIHGSKHVNESVPRMLTVWFDLGSFCVPDPTKRRGINAVPYQTECDQFIKELIKNLERSEIPLYYFMTSFPQLLSRICHPYEKIRNAIIKIISQLMSEYPKQSFWMMIGTVNNHTTTLRPALCGQILEEAIKSKRNLKHYFERAKQLSQLLIELCDYKCDQKIPKNITFPMVTKIKELLKKEKEFLLPYQRLMNVRLPSKLNYQSKHHLPFSEPVYIRDIDENIEVISSLQRPKKITFIGSDGKKYPMICKPKDDLRKDHRTMEFMNLVNFHLKKDPETRKRQLSIRTYTVVPLDQECGLVEWVENLVGIRSIVENYYTRKGVNSSLARISLTKAKNDEKVVKFKQLMKDFFEPAVFSQFFIENFNDPTAWYLARISYVRSCAVMSIVGYVIGLGDRHLENILINVITGQLVHVDFNVLFNKGETLQTPELVPFRLTHNLVDAMGNTGYEGCFLITCEKTLQVMREQIDALMSVLKPFVYDPLLESSEEKPRSRGRKSVHVEYEVISENALKRVNDIEERLRGILKKNNKPLGLPLSVSGQEATSVQNLAKMYVGWAPYY